MSRRSATARSSGPAFVPALLGDISHAAFEELVVSKGIYEKDLDQRVGAAWEGAWERVTAEIAAGLPPEPWPGQTLTRERFNFAAERLQALLVGLGLEAEIACEQPMQALDGRLHGRPDLVVRASDSTTIIDFKSGKVREQETGEVKAEYAAQLRLYALLEQEATRVWPDRGVLLPLVGDPVELSLDSRECRELGERISASIELFNDRVPDPQPASPSREACQWCDHAVACDAVWSECEGDWAPETWLVQGTVLQATPSAMGVATVVIDVDAGTVPLGRVAIVGIPLHRLGLDPIEIATGRKARASGLRRKGESTFSLSEWGTIAFDQP